VVWHIPKNLVELRSIGPHRIGQNLAAKVAQNVIAMAAQSMAHYVGSS